MDYKKLFDLKNKTAVVTGGCGILGRGFCSGLASHGAKVAVVDIKKAEAEKAAAELTKRYGVPALGIGCDITDPGNVKAMVSRVTKAWKRIDILHNNAAAKARDLRAFFQPLENYSLKTWQDIMKVNLDAMFLVAQAVGKVMKKQKSGSIIQTASIYGILAPDQRIYEGSFYLGGKINTPAVYSASKGGVVALSKYLASYWAKDGIRVNTLTPGGVRSGQNSVFVRNYSKRVPLGRMAEADEMIGALVFLASDASSYVTGQNVIVDGGLSVW